MTQKTLLIFAHAGEASAFREALLPGTDILICKEGLHEAQLELALYLAEHKQTYQRLINLGIVGSLSNKFSPGQIVSIKTVYAENQFKTFALNGEADLISAENRIRTTTDKARLGLIAPLVDRELWALSQVAKRFQLPLSSYKLISDLADESLNCENIKTQAAVYSDRLLEYYLKIESNIHTLPDQAMIPHEWQQYFHFSHTQKNKLVDLINRLEKQDQLMLWSQALLQSCLDHHVLPKERTNFLLKKLQHMLNPMMQKVEDKLLELVAPITAAGAKVQFAPDFEENYFTVTMKIEHEKNLTRLSEGLKLVKFEQVVQTLEGEDHV